MVATSNELKFAKEYFEEVHHTTLNPEGPGVVRIHLVPPKIQNNYIGPSVAIINGQDIIPVSVGWSILLTCFIEEVNVYDGREITEEDFERIRKNTIKRMKKVYPLVSKKLIIEDLDLMMTTFKQVAYKEEVSEEIGYVSIGDYAPLMKAPHRMDLLVSAMEKDGRWNCNQQCIHCYAAGQSNANEKELSTKDWKGIIQKCRKAGIPQLTFTGGEPTMREDLPELIEEAKWFVTRLNTNGIRLSEEYCAKLKQASLDSMQITFYSCEEEIHNTLVGAKQYENTLRGIKNAIAAGISVSVNTPLCTLNKEYRKTLEFLHSLGVLYVTCSGLIMTGNAKTEDSAKYRLEKEDLKMILKDAVAYCHENGMEMNFTSPGWIENEFLEELKLNPPTCGACLSNMAITPSGKVVPCQSWLSGEVLGDMLNDRWKDIWEGKACVERRKYSSDMLGLCPLWIKGKEEKKDE